MDNKNIFAKNLQKYMDLNGKTRREICRALGFNYYTFTSWVNGTKYPRMDKVELLAQYFGVTKSDLIENKMTPKKEKDNDVMSDIIVRMRTDKKFFSVVERMHANKEFFSVVGRMQTDEKFFSVVDSIYEHDAGQLDSVAQMLQALHTFGK